jgi:hypothetical protein
MAVSGLPQSKTPGVIWDKQNGKWRGAVSNPLKRTASGGRKNEGTSYFVHEADCIAATAVLRARVDAEYRTHVTALVAADPVFNGVPMGPEDAAEVEVETVYWRPNMKNDHKPFLVVRGGQKRVEWKPACQVKGCTSKAEQAVKGAAKEFCVVHGGHCPHGHAWVNCMRCNDNVLKRMAICSDCPTMIDRKRQRSKNGSGLCPGCEGRAAASDAALAAAVQGLPPPPPPKKAKLSKEHELKMLERLILAGYHETTEKGLAPRQGQFVREVYIDYRCALAREFEGDEKKFSYVDFVVNPKKGGRLVFLEVDENEHKCDNYTTLCDSTRMWNSTTSLALNFSGNVNVLWIRLNPNTQFKIGSVLHKSTNTQRADAVCTLLDTIEGTPNDPPMAVCYACYQMATDCTALITRDPDYHKLVRDGVVRLTHSVGPGGGVVLSF